MAQSKILLDTNSYLRLAKSVHPLLFVEFGSDPCCLYVIPEVHAELNKSPRLQTMFSWVSDPEYSANRTNFPAVSRKNLKEIDRACEILWDHVQTELPGPSRVDARNLAYSFVLGIPVVTDDRDMRELGQVFHIPTMASLELMSLMCRCNHITRSKVHQIMDYWRYTDDLPSNADSDFARLFGQASE